MKGSDGQVKAELEGACAAPNRNRAREFGSQQATGVGIFVLQGYAASMAIPIPTPIPIPISIPISGQPRIARLSGDRRFKRPISVDPPNRYADTPSQFAEPCQVEGKWAGTIAHFPSTACFTRTAGLGSIQHVGIKTPVSRAQWRAVPDRRTRGVEVRRPDRANLQGRVRRGTGVLPIKERM